MFAYPLQVVHVVLRHRERGSGEQPAPLLAGKTYERREPRVHPCCAALLTSLMVMLPSGPEPSISERSILSSSAFFTAACVALGSWLLPPACSPCWS